MANYGLFLDRESVGQRVNKNPTVALGVALIDMDNLCLATFDGETCIKEVYIPKLPHQELDQDCIKDFWEANESNKRQLSEWLQNHQDISKRDEIVKDFVQYCEKICEGRNVELFVDTALYDVIGIDALLDSTAPWDDKPPSWSFLLKKDNKRVYTRIIDISSYLEGTLFLHPGNAMIARNIRGGMREAVRQVFGIPAPPFPFPYRVDHHCSHDAARVGWEFAWIRAYLKQFSVKF